MFAADEGEGGNTVDDGKGGGREGRGRGGMDGLFSRDLGVDLSRKLLDWVQGGIF